ncbi:PstS family phosphate ABC transporter substrate-binding protein [Aliikangiella marina]|uniref:PstS family phosphate ABC transporter substrate-binding protein n=1 Tax=Aliikangiella marina TaxID=1712262 RepID=UPI003CCC69A5
MKSQGATLIKTIQLESPVEKIIEGVLPGQKRKLQIDIRAHGSSTGFKALTEQSTEIAMSSRSIKNSELDSLTATFGKVDEHPIALDALAIVTYQDNPIEALTIEQIAKIFSGEISNWSQLGGEDQAIYLFSRDNNSGTWDTFKSLVLKPFDVKLSDRSARFESSAELVNRVVSNKGAVGFVGVAYVGESKLLKVAANDKSPATQPSGYTIGTEDYALSRKLYFYTTGTKRSEMALKFIEFVTQNEGQKLADDVGLISYYPTSYRPKNLDKQTPLRYRELAATGRRITVNFANDVKAEEESKESRDLQRLQNFAFNNPGKKIVLVDFSNSPRLAEIRTKLEDNAISVLDTMRVDYAPLRSESIEVWVL